MVVALVPFSTFPSGQDEKVWNVVKLPRDPTVHLPLQIQKLIHKEIKIGRRCFSLERNGKSNPVEEAGGNRGKQYELGTSRKMYIHICRFYYWEGGSWGHWEKQICLSFINIKACKSNTQKCLAADSRREQRTVSTMAFCMDHRLSQVPLCKAVTL